MFNDPKNVLRLIGADDRVLDVGGGVEVFPRANAVVDVLPFAERRAGFLQLPERFDERDWHVGDICSESVWRPFRDREFDFVVCSHVLEDVRDPIFVCSQLIRVARAGYIEVPSRFRECAKAAREDDVTGWEHHRWIVDVADGRIAFTQKNPWVHRFDFLGDARRHYLQRAEHTFTAVHWIGSFDYVERNQKGSPAEVENLFLFYDHYPYERLPPMHVIDGVSHSGKTFEWISEFRLPVEEERSREDIVAGYRARLEQRRAPHGAAEAARRRPWRLFGS